MKLILKTLLKARFPKSKDKARSNDDEGFAIPIVMALGLLMTFIGILGIFKSNEEEIAAISQRKRERALAAAEKGINDYRLLLDRNKTLAIYNSSSWTSTGKPLCDNTATITSAVNSGNWISINGNPRFGQYRLVSYTYSKGNGNQPDGNSEGILIVEGVSGDNDKPPQATARLQVNIPIQRPVDQAITIPALWLKNDTTNDIKGVVIGDSTDEGDIVLSAGSTSCDSATLTGFNSSSTFINKPNDQFLAVEPIDIPAINSYITNAVTGKPEITSQDLNTILPSAYSTPYATLPASFPSNASIGARNKTLANAKGNNPDNTYYYQVDGNLTINKNINIQDNVKVVLYVTGNLEFDSSSNPIKIWSSNSSSATHTSAYLEIYVVGNNNKVTFKGNNLIEIKGFIHAPDARVEIDNTNKVKIIGSLWAKSLKNKTTTGTMDIVPDLTASTSSNYPTYFNYSSTSNILIPTIAPPDQWERQEIR